MKIFYIKKFLFLFSIFSLLTFCKKKEHEKTYDSFELRVVASSEIDSISLWPSWVDKEFVDTTLFNDISKSNNGEFVFKGKMPYPHIMQLYAYDTGASKDFFIEKGNTTISVAFQDYDQDPEFSGGSKSRTQREYEYLRKTNLSPIKEALFGDKITKEEFIKQRDSVLVDHLKLNPNSYVVLWLMLNSFSGDFAYREHYEVALDSFSDEIKQLDIWKKFKEKITLKKDFSFVDRDLALKDINETDTTFSLKDFKDNKFLLIDFWYSNCGPCRVSMPKLKPIYDKYKTKGFEIVSISTDKSEEDVLKWKGLIKEKGFNWVHYLDLGGPETRRMKISSFPTTYLVDTHGNIIKKNINSEDLEKFLSESL